MGGGGREREGADFERGKQNKEGRNKRNKISVSIGRINKKEGIKK